MKKYAKALAIAAALALPAVAFGQDDMDNGGLLDGLLGNLGGVVGGLGIFGLLLVGVVVFFVWRFFFRD